VTRRSLSAAVFVAVIAGFASAVVEDVASGVVCAALVGCGVLALSLRPHRRTGVLLVLTGVAWFAGSLDPALVLVHRVPLVYLILSYPTGRLRTMPGRLALVATTVTALAPALARAEWATLVTAGLVGLAAVHRYARSAGPMRRATGVALVGALAYTTVLSVAAVERMVTWEAGAGILLAYEAVVAAIAIGSVAGLVAGRWTEATIADLVIDLGASAETGTLRDRLAAAVGDPSLVIGYRIAENEHFVDDAGRVVDKPPSGSRMAVTEIGGKSEPSAIVIHDRAVDDDERVWASVGSAVRIAVDNARLQASIRSRVSQIRDSRSRIVRAADEQRLLVAGELDRGAERRLAHVATLLAAAADHADIEFTDVQRAVSDARDELRNSVQGIRPAALTHGGLAAAIPILVARSPVPVDVNVEVGRLEPAVEGALYFACAEALTNVAKHASATRASVDVGAVGSMVTAVVADNGVGGAGDTGGSGLRGLTDRIEALGGTVVVDSPPGRGTRMVFSVPVALAPPDPPDRIDLSRVAGGDRPRVMAGIHEAASQ
jgi:signal transduction histidine kinase